MQPSFGNPMSGFDSPPAVPTDAPQMFAVSDMQLRKRGQGTAKPRPKYVPVDDGFGTTAGKADRGARYGNLAPTVASLAVPPPPPMGSFESSGFTPTGMNSP